jgi:hypothetical protein
MQVLHRYKEPPRELVRLLLEGAVVLVRNRPGKGYIVFYRLYLERLNFIEVQYSMAEFVRD